MILLKENVTGNKLAKTLGKKNKPKKSSLSDYYTKKWKDLRKKVLDRDNHTCTKCKGKNKILHCHHLYYTSGRLRYEYPISALVTLCKECHENAHKIKSGSKMVISEKSAIKKENKALRPKIKNQISNNNNIEDELRNRFLFLISGND